MESCPKHALDIRGRDLGDEYLFYDATGRRVHVLNHCARRVWIWCDGTRTVTELVDRVMETYSVEEGRAQKDVAGVIQDLLDLGLLTLDENLP
jgi:hypothetical protein